MAAEENRTDSKPAEDRISYSAFLEKLELKAIRLKRIEAHTSIIEPPENKIEIVITRNTDIIWEEGEQDFACLFSGEVNFKDKQESTLLNIKAEYELLFGNEEEFTKEMLDSFENNNLIAFAWPYFRMLVSETMTNMSLPPFLLPVLIY
jgi:preprotein translocase subunit SecB